MWAGENRRNTRRMESLYAKDSDSILNKRCGFRKNRRKIKKRERERERRIHNKEGRDWRDEWTRIEGSISSIDAHEIRRATFTHPKIHDTLTNVLSIDYGRAVVLIDRYVL